MYLKKYISFDTSLSIAGSIFVAFGIPFYANCIWGVANLFMIRRNYLMNKDMPQVTLFIIYEVVAVMGIINHFRGVY